MIQLTYNLNRKISIGNLLVYHIDIERRQGKSYYTLEINGDKTIAIKDKLIELAKNTEFKLQHTMLSGENISGTAGYEFKFLPRFSI